MDCFLLIAPSVKKCKKACLTGVTGCDRYTKKSHVTKKVTGYHTFLSAQHDQCPYFLIKSALSFKGLGIQKRIKTRA